MYLVILLAIVYILVYLDYNEKINTFPYKWRHIKKEYLLDLGIVEKYKEKTSLYLIYHYEFQNVEIVVTRRKFCMNVIVGSILIKKANKNHTDIICEYNQLSKKFKTELYKKFCELRHIPYQYIKTSNKEKPSSSLSNAAKQKIYEEKLNYYKEDIV